MELISQQEWAIIHLSLIFALTCVHLAVAYVLSDSSTPPEGLGLYTVYFMAALLGWIAFTLEQIGNFPMTVDVPSVASILNSFILFLAVGERTNVRRGRVLLGAICTAACLAVFFLPADTMFALQISVAAFFFFGAGLLAARRAYAESNLGDAVTCVASIVMVIAMPVALYQALLSNDAAQAQTIAFAAYSIAYVLVCLGFLASVAIEYQQHLSHHATQDPLTRLLNRRGLERALSLTMAQAARQQQPIAAIMVDIDQVDDINLNFGHEVGDQVIRRVADILQRLSRGVDVAARTDGEEFLLVLPQTDIEGARILAERIRESVAGQAMVVDNHRVPVTISLGVASIPGGESLDKLSQDADRAMHLAKRSGRNRVASVESKPIHLSSRGSGD